MAKFLKKQNAFELDIENRKPIWAALSEFYLDTELSGADFDRIAIIFKNSGLPAADIRQIDLLEVFPVLRPNLLSVAGVWDGFDEAWLFSECQKRYARRDNLLHRLNCRFWSIFFYRLRRHYWSQIEKR